MAEEELTHWQRFGIWVVGLLIHNLWVYSPLILVACAAGIASIPPVLSVFLMFIAAFLQSARLEMEESKLKELQSRHEAELAEIHTHVHEMVISTVQAVFEPLRKSGLSVEISGASLKDIPGGKWEN